MNRNNRLKPPTRHGYAESIVQVRKTVKISREVGENNICVRVGVTPSVQVNSMKASREVLADVRLLEPA
jgi:hypothetical protein